MILDFINMLTEAADPRTPHPEDAIFNGSAAAAQQVAGLKAVIANPDNLTIKWDGKPALIFGRDTDGQLAVMDKYMWDAGSMAKSVQDWQTYDANKASGNLRGSLYDLLAASSCRNLLAGRAAMMMMIMLTIIMIMIMIMIR